MDKAKNENQKHKNSEEFLKNLINSIDDPVFVKDREHRWVFLNDAACKLWGYEKEQLIGKSDYDIFPKEQADIYWEKDELVLKNEKPGLNEEAQTINGKLHTISTMKSIYRDPETGEKYIVGTIRDITEHKKTEKALAESEKRFRQIAELFPLPISIINSKGTYEFLNNEFTKVFGYTLKDIPTGRDWFRKAHPDSKYRKEVISIWLSDLEKSREYEVREREFKVTCKDEKVRDIIFRPVTIEDEKQFIVYEDLSERKKAEAEKEKIQDQLRQSHKIEAVGRLAGGIAHDFNNLLTAILGYSEILLRGKLPKDTHQYVEEIKKAADRAASLTQQLLAFSRKQIMKPKILNLNELIKNLNQMLQRLITEDIDLVTSLDPELTNIQADPGQIEQVIVNLAVNARDAMLTGGELMITTKKVYLDNEFCKGHRGSRPGNYIQLEISDTGKGMDEEIKKHIFEPFFTTKEVGKGTGLGLATVFGIVKQSNGYTWVESELNRGTTVTIYFPQIDKLEKKEKASSEEMMPKGGSEKILIVEDEDAVRSMTSKTLRDFGYTVIEARDGIEALANCEEKEIRSIDLLIVDVVMPKMSGRDLTNQLLAKYPKMKVLYISGYTDDVIVHHGVLYKGLPFLQKPFTLSMLSKKVREVMGAI